MTDATNASPRWRTWAKIALTILLAIVATPFLIMSLLGSVQGERR